MDLSDASEKIPSDTTGIDPGTFRLRYPRPNWIIKVSFGTVNWRLEEAESRHETRKLTKIYTLGAMRLYE